MNINSPEANREVLVLTLKDIKGMKLGIHNCRYYLMVPMYIRFILDHQTVKHYKAQAFANHLMMVPSWTYYPLYNPDEINNKVDKSVMDAMDDACFHLKKTRHLTDGNTGGHDLSAKVIYEDAGDDEELKLELIPLDYGYTGVPSNSINTIHWKVARSNLRVSRRKKAEHRENKSKAVFLLAGLMKS